MELNYNTLNYGELHDILIANKKSEFANKIIDVNMLNNEIIYVPEKKSQSIAAFLKNTKIESTHLKNISYNTMLIILENNNNIGLVTKEYVEHKLEKHGLIELKINFKIEPIEFGIYVNDTKFKELNNLIKIIKTHFLN